MPHITDNMTDQEVLKANGNSWKVTVWVDSKRSQYRTVYIRSGSRERAEQGGMRLVPQAKVARAVPDRYEDLRGSCNVGVASP